MNLEHVEVPEGAVIIVRDRDGIFDDAGFRDFVGDLHEKFPTSLVIWFSGDETFETMSVENAKEMLQAILDHEEAISRTK